MSSKEVKIRVTGDVSDLLKKLDMVKNSFDKLNTDKISNKGINSLIDNLSDVDKKVEKTVDSMDDLADATSKVGKKNITGIADDLSDTNKKIDNTVKGFEDLNKQINDVDAKPFNALDKQIASLYENTNDVKDAFSETFDTLDDFTNTKNKIKIDFDDNADPNSFLDDITDNLMQASITGKIVGNSISQSFDNVSDSVSQSFDSISDTIRQSISNVDDLKKAVKDIADSVGGANPSAMKDYFDKLHDNALNQMDDALEKQDWDAFDKASRKADAAFENWKEYSKLEKEALSDKNKQVEAYKKLREESLAFINNEENHEALREKTARYLEEARLALNRIGVEVEGIPKDVFDKLNKDVAKFIKNVKDSSRIISFDKIEKDLNRLGKNIDDKTLKMVSNNEAFQSANWKARETTEGFEKASKSIIDFGNNANYAFKKVEKDGQIIEQLTTKIKDFSDAQSEYIQKVNEDMAEYQVLKKEFGEDISEKFLTDGEFDPKKYVEAYEKTGAPIDQLTMRYKILKQQILEYLKLEDESIENKAKAIREINDYAESLRKLGATIEGIDLSDIESFDKSLASNLNNTFKDLFDNDIPGNFKEIKDEIKAAFDELGNLELGKASDLFGNAAKGFAKNILSKIPAQVKAATASIAGLIYVADKLYEAGKQQFFEGLSDIANKLQPVINAIQSFGREAISAFEEITNTQLDLSSLMVVGPEFEYQMQRVGSIAGSNDKQLQKLTDTAERLGGTTQFTASQVGEAFEYMAMAGYDTEEMLASIDDTLNLAKISGTDLGTVSDIVTDGLTSMGMSAADTGEFVDKLTATITSSNTNIELFGNTLKQVGSLAGSLGINMTDLSTAIGLSANAGIKGERAGTSLKNVLSNMASPTKEQAAALQQLGLTADKTGSYLKTTADGNVDLAATMKSLMKATDGMTNTQKASILTQIAGKEAIAGLMSIMNQGEEAWDELSNTIENSTGKVQYWNECMSLAGKSGSEAVKLIDNMKQVFSEVESEAQAAGLSTEDLSNAIALLGDDGKVTSDNVRDLLSVIESMNTATGDTEKAWRALDKSGKSAVNTGYDYDATVSAITADTQGLTQAQKESMIAELGKAKTYEEAIEIGKKYSQGNIDMTKTIERASFANMSYAEKLEYLRDNLKGLSDEERKAALESLGLGNAVEEVNEIVNMSDKEFEAYTKNLETIQSMSEQLANAMDEVTKGSLLSLASAIQNAAIKAFNNFKPAIQNASNALTEFFDTWHNGDDNKFTFQGLENALHNLSSKILGEKNTIRDAIAGLFDGLNIFINEGSFQSILDIGTSVITGICDGIKKSYDSGTLTDAISGAIKRICDFITKNGPQIREAGKDVLDALMKGIEENQDAIYDAMDVVCDIIEDYIDGEGKMDGVMSKFGSRLMELRAESIKSAIKTKVKEEWNKFFGGLFDFDLTKKPKGGGIFTNGNLANLIFGDFDPIKDIKNWFKDKFKGFNLMEFIKGLFIKPGTGKSGPKTIGAGINVGDLFGKLPTVEEAKKWIQDKIGNWHPIQWIKEKIFKGGTTSKSQDSGNSAIKPEQLIKLPSLGDFKNWIQSKISNWHPIQWIKEALFGKGGTTSKSQDSGNSAIKPEQLIKLPSLDEIKGWIEGKIGDFHPIKWIQEKWNQVKDFGNDALKWVDNLIPDDLGTKISEKIQKVLGDNWFTDTIGKIFGNKDSKQADVSDLLKIDTTKLENTKKVLESLGETATAQAGVVKTAFADIQNSARTSFVGLSNIINNQAQSARDHFTSSFMSIRSVARNQMVAVTSIVRNQAVNWSNIINNQAQNARNHMTSSFMSMRSVARNQMVAVSNIIRNQAVTWSNIIRNQAANMRSAMTSAFAGMAASARAGMANVLSVVRSYMAQIRSETSKTMTMNFQVSKTVTTTNVTKNVTKGLRNTMGAISRGSAPLAAPQAMSIGGYATSMSSIGGLAAGGSITLDVPLYLDGKEVARATAVYNEQELAKLAKRNNRKRGE